MKKSTIIVFLLMMCCFVLALWVVSLHRYPTSSEVRAHFKNQGFDVTSIDTKEADVGIFKIWLADSIENDPEIIEYGQIWVSPWNSYPSSSEEK